MKQSRGLPVAAVSPKAEHSLRNGHPWVYDTELRIVPVCEDGDIVDVLSEKGRWLGSGFYNSHSKIRIRILSRNPNDRFDPAFWERRLRYAVDYRKTVMGPNFECCRLIFGEADSFPGLTVDRFGDLLSVQVLSLGMERLKSLLLPRLVRILEEEGAAIRGVYERNDVAIRELEGLPQQKAPFPLDGKAAFSPRTVIRENGIEYEVDVENGQKTGFFLDQKYNRQAVARLAAGKRVLDCFTHTGSFALNAGQAGAAHVHAVDISESAIDMTRENIARNHLDSVVSAEAANVFDLLPSLGGHDYDFIILDPPAFTKSRQTVESAMRGYKEINLRAMRLLPRGGYLATCSCSHFMTEELFCRMLRSAASDADVQLRQIEARQQSPDHPILWNVPETNYLKFYLFQVV